MEVFNHLLFSRKQVLKSGVDNDATMCERERERERERKREGERETDGVSLQLSSVLSLFSLIALVVFFMPDN